jgi:hypothetical protein
MPAPYYSLPFPPEDQILSQMEALLRTGLPPALDGTEWTGATCPAGHWLMPQGARVYRGDEIAEMQTPCVVLYFMRDAEPLLATHQHHWRLAPSISVIWNRDLTTQETDQIRFCLLALFTQDMTAPVPTEQRSVHDRLSLDPTDDTPGLRVFDVRNVQCALDRSNAGHPEFVLTFDVLAMALQLTD